MVKVYSPSTKTVKSYKLGDEINVTVNSQAIIPIIADKIYKSPYSAVRELYNNEVTACKKAIKINPKLDPRIEIKLNTQTRELTIMGIDSLGIDSETFTKILAIMGNSGNNNGEDMGYFGLGFYSFVKISERIIIISNSLETGEKWGMICKSALKFEKLKDKQYDPLDKTGFKIILNVKNELNFNAITEKVKEISKLSGIKTSYYIDGDMISLVQYDNLENYFKQYYSEYFDQNHPPYSIVYRHINKPEYELIIGFISGDNDKELINECTLLNTPIELDFYTNKNQLILINIKSERIFKPTPDRERFEEESETKIKKIIEDNNFEYNEELPTISNINEWYNSKSRHFIRMVGKVDLDIRVKNHNAKGSEWDKTKYRWKSLRGLLPNEKPNGFKMCFTMRTKAFIKCEDNNEFACCVDTKDSFKRLQSIGFIDIDHGKKKKSKSLEYDPNRKTNNFKFWNKNGVNEVINENNNSIIFKVEDVKNNVLKSHYPPNYVYWITERADYEGHNISELIDFIDKDHMLFTNEGLKTIGDIITEIDNDRKLSELRNSAGIDEKDHYLKHLFTEELNNNLIVKFDKSRPSQLLELYYSVKSDSYLSRHSIDVEDIVYKKWESTITNKALKFMMEDIGHYSLNDDKMKNVITGLQRSLK